MYEEEESIRKFDIYKEEILPIERIFTENEIEFQDLNGEYKRLGKNNENVIHV